LPPFEISGVGNDEIKENYSVPVTMPPLRVSGGWRGYLIKGKEGVKGQVAMTIIIGTVS
jgi:hypothetical protein